MTVERDIIVYSLFTTSLTIDAPNLSYTTRADALVASTNITEYGSELNLKFRNGFVSSMGALGWDLFSGNVWPVFASPKVDTASSDWLVEV